MKRYLLVTNDPDVSHIKTYLNEDYAEKVCRRLNYHHNIFMERERTEFDDCYVIIEDVVCEKSLQMNEIKVKHVECPVCGGTGIIPERIED